ncbi:MAG: HD-GYP domain-containing protein [Firmicutes bacterium]|nr:HD-GYP domain-containing protein [Bacillota bacterium]
METHGFTLVPQGHALSTMALPGMDVSLVASGDGTEIILHRLDAGAQWALGPSGLLAPMEGCFILDGILRSQGDTLPMSLVAGDTLYAQPVTQDCVFVADTEVRFLYFSSQPVFHMYTGQLQQMMDLAVAVEQKDGYTADHCQRIMDLSMAVAKAMGLGPTQLYNLNLAAFLHDVGKVRVPEEILQKPGALTAQEWEIMKLHTVYGRDMLEETGLPVLARIGQIVVQHHERHSGTGYPVGLKGDQISIEAAVIAVVDSYDAMTTDRVYKRGRTIAEAHQEIASNRGLLFEPTVVDAFLSLALS